MRGPVFAVAAAMFALTGCGDDSSASQPSKVWDRLGLRPEMHDVAWRPRTITELLPSHHFTGESEPRHPVSAAVVVGDIASVKLVASYASDDFASPGPRTYRVGNDERAEWRLWKVTVHVKRSVGDVQGKEVAFGFPAGPQLDATYVEQSFDGLGDLVLLLGDDHEYDIDPTLRRSFDDVSGIGTVTGDDEVDFPGLVMLYPGFDDGSYTVDELLKKAQ